MVRITVEQRRINRIRIQGPPNEVTAAVDKIHHIFHEVTKQEHDKFISGQVAMLVVFTMQAMVCLSVCLSVRHKSEMYKDG